MTRSTRVPDDSHRPTPRRLKTKIIGAWIVLSMVGLVAADYWVALSPEATATYVGRDRCITCHQDQTELFLGSHHDRAMDRATDETVLGDFSGVTLEHDGIISRMFRRDRAFMVNTEGPDGQMDDFEVKYVFGCEPLQQYMVEFDRPADASENEIGRLQVLRISWDTINNRWFYLRPPDVNEKLEPDDPLHWTGIAQRWQTMCAECHSTDLHKNFDPSSGTYHTTFSEIDVSCEACHGPGSLHVELANGRSLFWDRHHGYGLARLKGDDPQPQLQSCAPCHSRRGELTDSFEAGMQFCNHFQLETLRDDTYHADGQIKDEVYVYGSFLQSRMYHQGIRCTDCHDSHSLKLKHDGNETCTSCHQHAAGKYDVPSHHHHAVGSAGAQCVNCHMPHTTYMAIDQRRDHSLRVPRPDLSVTQATPNACSACHIQDQLQTLDQATRRLAQNAQYADWLRLRDEGNTEIADAIKRTDQWCDQACEKWYGGDRQQPKHFSESIVALRRGDPDAAAAMLNLALSHPSDKASLPEIARASLLGELAGIGLSPESVPDALDDLAADPQSHPMVRSEAARLILSAGPERAEAVLMQLIQDDTRQVRISAAQALVESGLYRVLTGERRLQVDQVIDGDVRTALMTASDRAASHLNWAGIQEQRERYQDAIDSYRTAIRVEPETTGGRSNLASLLERLANGSNPAQAETMRATAKRLRQAELRLLQRDAGLFPENATLQYRLGLALYLDGQFEAARDALQRAHQLEPQVPVFKQALDSIEERLGQPRK